MDYSLSYSGVKGNLNAVLTHKGETVATAVVKDIDAAEKWAAKEARDHKAINIPAPTAFHGISGGRHFTL